jgi:hypothetical protein
MAITRTFAKKYLSRPEFQIVELSFADQMKSLDSETAKKNITLARRHRDKFRDLARRQKLETRGKKTQRNVKAPNAELAASKAKLFEEALLRYESFLEDKKKLSAKSNSKKKPSAVKKKASNKSTKKKVVKKKPGSKKASAKKLSVKFNELLEKRKQNRLKKEEAKKAKKSKASSASSLVARKSKPLKRNHSKAINAHVGARGRRNQAKRDSR